MSLPELGRSRSIRWLVPVIYVISALAFLLDLQRDNTLAYGIVYSPLVATAVFHKGRAGLWILAVGTCLLVVVGAFVPAIGPDLEDLIGNRVLSIVAIIATAAFVRHARDTQDRLAAESRRAEAAERIKTDVLGTLSAEIRNPLHSLLGVLTLTIAGSAPGQREPLIRVRSDARQLLQTIDSLIDLSDLSDRGLRLTAIDLSAVAGEAVASAATVAKERQINVTQPTPGRPGDTAAIGDPAAIRRILDNFLMTALRMSKPGETVAVTVARNGNIVTASVSDPGHRLTLSSAGVPAEGSAGDGDSTGLTLSQRLAQAMGGSIAAEPRAGTGDTAICLRLRAA
jgi:signal transduction histidine kinase